MSDFALTLLFLGPPVALVVGWAIWRGPKVFDGWVEARRRRREILRHRVELASDVLAELRAREGMPSARKPYVTAPETHDEESAVAEGPEVNPWLWILIRPRATIRQIVDVDPQLHVMLLSCAYGINAVVGLNDGMPWRTGIGNMRYVVLLPLALVAGPLLGIVSVSVISWCSRVAAGWVDGVASEHETQAALAWSMVAEIYTFPLTLATALATSPDVGLGLSPSAEGLIQLNLVVSLAARLWSLVLFVNALAEVNRFSRQRALLSMIAGFCIFAGAIVLLVLLIAAINLVLR